MDCKKSCYSHLQVYPHSQISCKGVHFLSIFKGTKEKPFYTFRKKVTDTIEYRGRCRIFSKKKKSKYLSLVIGYFYLAS